jgi:hypothetical protein
MVSSHDEGHLPNVVLSLHAMSAVTSDTEPKSDQWSSSIYLIDEVLAMIIAELLCSDNAVKIRLHELLNKVDLLELFEGVRTEYIKDGDDVLMAEVKKKAHFTECSQAEH